MLYIQLKGMEHRLPCKQISCPYLHPQLADGVKRPKYFFSESSHVAYQIKGNRAWSTYSVLHIPSTCGLDLKVKERILNVACSR